MKKYIWMMAAVLTGMTACNKEEILDLPVTSEKPEVTVTMELKAKELVETRSMNENRISDVNLYLFGAMDYHFYYSNPGKQLDFGVVIGDYRLYAVTNAHKDMGELSEAELLKYQIKQDAMYSNQDIPMTATRDITVSSSTTTLPAMVVERNAAKIEYTISVDSSDPIKLRSVQFCNVPLQETLFGDGKPSTNASDYTQGELIELGNGTNYSGTTYLFENAQGIVSSIKDQKDKSPSNAPTYATYMRIFAQGKDKVLEYIVYLGCNNTTDFNVLRNTHHKMNIVIKGENEVDNRVFSYDGLYYGDANCYLIAPGRGVNIQPRPYRTSRREGYRYTGIYAGAEYEPSKVKILWKDNRSLSLSVYFVGSDLIVQHGGKELGNALIGIYDSSDNLLWSFHIWVNSVTNTVYAQNSLGKEYTVMNQNLGAVSMIEGNKGSYGLLYQWGRKDPFVGADDLKSTTDAGMWVTSSTTVSFDAQPVSSGSTLASVARNPLTFYYGNRNWYDGEVDKYLWGNPNDNSGESVKTVFDPSPKGYRVAPRDLALAFSKNGKLETSSSQDTQISNYYYYKFFNYGWEFYADGRGISKITYYSSPGMRDGSLNGKGALTNVGTQGYYWTSANKNGNYFYVTNFSSSSISLNAESLPVNAMTVRCIKE